MKAKQVNALVTLACLLIPAAASAQGSAQPSDPCGDKGSTVEMRECYTKAQAQATNEADSLASAIAAKYTKQAGDAKLGPAVTDLLKKGATAVKQSQATWKSYRDQHCKAVAFSFTTGSGAGTAYESCLLRLAQARALELKSAFD